jgi:hypothetical protein
MTIITTLVWQHVSAKYSHHQANERSACCLRVWHFSASLSNFYEIWYERCATGGHHNVMTVTYYNQKLQHCGPKYCEMAAIPAPFNKSVKSCIARNIWENFCGLFNNKTHAVRQS